MNGSGWDLFKGIYVYFNRLEESVADSCGVLSHSAKTPDLDFFSLVIFEGMVTNRKAKKEEMEGRYRAMPRQTFQTFHSSQKWIKLIKLV